MYRDEKLLYQTLTFDDVFTDATTFEDKLTVFAMFDLSSLMPFDELYFILAIKYAGAFTRYTDEYAFTMALVRELKIHWPIYKQQKYLMDSLMELELNEIIQSSKSLRNYVENPNVLQSDLDTVPINNYSTAQESILNSIGKLDAIKVKYQSVNKNYLEQVYKAIDGLFTAIYPDDVHYIYGG